MRSLSRMILALLCSAGPALAEPPTPAPHTGMRPLSPSIEPSSMRRHVEYLASPELEGRGTPAGKKLTLDYLQQHFENLGLEPLFGAAGWRQEIPGTRTAENGKPKIVGQNVGAILPGSDPQLCDEIIIVSAHYDHLGIRGGKLYPGADDNAGSVAMLLEVARRFAHAPQRPRRSIAFLSCDLEENMLWGARWFAAHPPWPIEQVKLFVTSELIGRDLGDLPLDTIFVLGAEHAGGLGEIVASVDTPAALKVAPLGIDLVGVRSDYGPFWAEKVPFLFFSGGEHRDYHKPTDTADRLDYERAAAVANLVFDVCLRVAEADEAPEWTDEPARNLDEVRTLYRITQLLLDADDAARAQGKPKLKELQRFSVSNVHTRTKQILDRGQLLPDDRPWLVRSSQLLLLTVF